MLCRHRRLWLFDFFYFATAFCRLRLCPVSARHVVTLLQITIRGIVLAQIMQWIDLGLIGAPELNNYGVLLYRKPTLSKEGYEWRRKRRKVIVS